MLLNTWLMLPVFMLTKSLSWQVMIPLPSLRVRANIFCLIRLLAAAWFTAWYSPPRPKNPKGILVCTTTHGNTFIGPNANEQDSKEDKAVTTAGMNEIIASAKKLIPNLPMGAAITEFAGLRAVSSTGDFVLGPSEKVEGLYNAAGMQSPGLTAAPAVGELIANEIARVSGAAKKADLRLLCRSIKHSTI